MSAHNFQDLIGNTYGFWTVIGPYELRNKNNYWRCQCVCGNKVYVAQGSLKNGKSVSCGCKRGLAPDRYKLKHHKAMTVLKNMKTRCYNKINCDYVYYGAQGIKICEEWLKDSYTFYKWFDEHYKPGLTVDRIDNNGNYSPSNCKFSTASEQCYNRKPWVKTWL